MPHDMKGRLIEKGDYVAATAYPFSKPRAMEVLSITEGTDTCNLMLVGTDPRFQPQFATAKETELLLKGDGSKPDAS